MGLFGKLLGSMLLMVAAAGCGGSDSKKSGDGTMSVLVAASNAKTFVVKMSLLTPVPSLQYTEATLSFVDAEDRPLEGVSEVAFVPWMAMGHGSLMTKQQIAAVPNQPGVFQVTGIYLTMGGTWEMKISAKVKDAALDSTIISVEAQ